MPQPFYLARALAAFFRQFPNLTRRRRTFGKW
jgi:hypothetical protein